MKPNVLLLILDSARARNISIYDYRHDTTPYLNELASEATKYKYAMVPAGSSQQSHTSMFTGLKSEEHGCFDRTDRLEQGHTIWESLRDNYDYSTGVFSANTYFSDLKVGLNHGFDRVCGRNEIMSGKYPFPDAMVPEHADKSGIYGYLLETIESDLPLKSFVNGLARYTYNPELETSLLDRTFLPQYWVLKSSGDSVIDLFTGWVQKQTQPWAACINIVEPHYPWYPGRDHDIFRETGTDLHEIQQKTCVSSDFTQMTEYIHGDWPIDDWEALEQLYNGALHKTDHQIRRLISNLEKQLDDTLLVITSDHGEAFGERDPLRDRRMVSHGSKLHNVVTHVPLLVKYPGQTEQKTIDSVSTLRLFPSAVKDVLQTNERVDRGIFVPESPVVATAAPFVSEQQAEKLQAEYGNIIYDHLGFERSVWLDTEDGVRQVRGWISTQTGDIEEVVREKFISPQQTEVVNYSGKDVLEENLKDVSDKDVRTSSVKNVSGETKQRMRELGYL